MTNKILINFATLAIGLFLSSCGVEEDADMKAARELTDRIVPSLSSKIEFVKIQSSVDTFAVGSHNGKVKIEGNNALSMSVGLNNYLKKCLGTHVSWYASQPIEVPSELILPEEDEPITGRAAVRDRFFLNYCTFGYTFPYWKWKDWERFIDWMALNGINMPLAMTGQEKIWFETWKSFGINEDSILQSFTGPAHLPWHWMANIDHFDGPLTQKWLDDNENLQKNILARERGLGMTPVMPAFAGHVPKSFKNKYPEANITLRSEWSDFQDEDRCWFLDPSDPLYAEIQKRFIAIQDSVFGSDHIYGIDPFNEVDAPDWSEEFLRGASSNIYSTLREADAEAKWLQMTWNFYYDSKNWTKPRIKAFLEGVPDDNLILLDYFCDRQPVWPLTESYFGKPYIWCYLGNFGGNTMMVGNLQETNERINDFLANGGENVTGIGGTLEGLDVNPFMHEFVLSKAWNPEMTPEEWIDEWAGARGAKQNQSIQNAWDILGKEVYIKGVSVGQGSLTDARPALKGRTGGYANPRYYYADEKLLEALDELLSVTDVDNPAYRYDVMNVTRQALGNRFTSLLEELVVAYEKKDIDLVKAITNQMDEIIVDLDRLMATNPDFSLSTWIDAARSNGQTPEEKDCYEHNVRTLLTTWGYGGTKLNDYANRQWSGLLGDFYRGRWQLFNRELISSMENGVPFDQDNFRTKCIEWEEDWTNSTAPVTKVSDENPIELARAYRQRYL